MGFLIRWLAAFLLLAATFNPTGLSYIGWLQSAWETSLPLAVLMGLVLLIAYVVFLTAVLRGIGSLGVLLLLAVIGALLWVLVDFGWIDVTNPTSNTWIGLVALSLVLAVGMYWGILWRRMSGQLEVDDNMDG